MDVTLMVIISKQIFDNSNERKCNVISYSVWTKKSFKMVQLSPGWLFFWTTQFFISVFFTYQAVVSWKETPTVTSGKFQFLVIKPSESKPFWWFVVSIEDVSEIPFPAVSICYPKTMMYPAVSKAVASKIESSEENKTIETIIARDSCFNWPYFNGQTRKEIVHFVMLTPLDPY